MASVPVGTFAGAISVSRYDGCIRCSDQAFGGEFCRLAFERILQIEPIENASTCFARRIACGLAAYHLYAIGAHGGCYDVDLGVHQVAGFRRRFAGRIKTGHDLISDPAMHGAAALDDESRYLRDGT